MLLHLCVTATGGSVEEPPSHGGVLDAQPRLDCASVPEACNMRHRIIGAGISPGGTYVQRQQSPLYSSGLMLASLSPRHASLRSGAVKRRRSDARHQESRHWGRQGRRGRSFCSSSRWCRSYAIWRCWRGGRYWTRHCVTRCMNRPNCEESGALLMSGGCSESAHFFKISRYGFASLGNRRPPLPAEMSQIAYAQLNTNLARLRM